MSCISTSLQHCGNTWNSPHTASSHGKASSLVWSSKTSSETKTDHLYHAMRALGIGLPYQQRKCISSTFHSETELRPLQLTYSRPPPSPPHRFHVPRAYPSFPYPHAKEHQPKFSSPVTTPDSYANGEGKFCWKRQSDIFFQYRLCVLMEVLHKHTFILVPLLHWHSPRATLAFLTRFLMFDWVQCHSERNAAFGGDRV